MQATIVFSTAGSEGSFTQIGTMTVGVLSPVDAFFSLALSRDGCAVLNCGAHGTCSRGVCVVSTVLVVRMKQSNATDDFCSAILAGRVSSATNPRAQGCQPAQAEACVLYQQPAMPPTSTANPTVPAAPSIQASHAKATRCPACWGYKRCRAESPSRTHRRITWYVTILTNYVLPYFSCL